MKLLLFIFTIILSFNIFGQSTNYKYFKSSRAEWAKYTGTLQVNYDENNSKSDEFSFTDGRGFKLLDSKSEGVRNSSHLGMVYFKDRQNNVEISNFNPPISGFDNEFTTFMSTAPGTSKVDLNRYCKASYVIGKDAEPQFKKEFSINKLEAGGYDQSYFEEPRHRNLKNPIKQKDSHHGFQLVDDSNYTYLERRSDSPLLKDGYFIKSFKITCSQPTITGVSLKLVPKVDSSENAITNRDSKAREGAAEVKN